MPAEFQRVMDSIPAKYPQAHAFIEKVLRKFENMALKLTKCNFTQNHVHWSIAIYSENGANRSIKTAPHTVAVQTIDGVVL